MKLSHTVGVIVLILGLMTQNSGIAAPYDGQRPVIGVSGDNISSKSARFIMARLYELGAYPILFDVNDLEHIDQHLAAVHAVVLAGNSKDINPEDYGAEKHDKTKNEDEEHASSKRSDYEYALLERTFARKIPTLGICGGMQRMNVTNHGKDGGTLIQHLEGPNQLEAVGERFAPHIPVEFLELEPNTKLAELAGDERDKPIAENSLHHQAVGRVRNGFRIAARNKSDTIEAIEADPNGQYGDHPLLMGVQWHPEYGPSQLSENILRHVVEKATEQAKDKPVTAEQVAAVDLAGPNLRKYLEMGCQKIRETHGYRLPDDLRGNNR